MSHSLGVHMLLKKLCLTLIFLMLLGNSAFAYVVVLNTNTLKYHSVDCEWAHKCNKNCIRIDHKEAKKRGGIPCKVCGGVEVK